MTTTTRQNDAKDNPAQVVPPEDTEWGTCTPLTTHLLHGTSDATSDDNEVEHDDDDDDKQQVVVPVAIVGGGLAGLAAAIGLHRAGIPCRVFESAPVLRSTSQGILAIQPNGMRALEKLHPDLPQLITAAGCERQQLVMTVVHADGTVQETVQETGQECWQKYGRYKVGITWHKMQQILASLLPPDTVVTSRSLVSFTENENDVVLHFQDHHHSTNKDDDGDDTTVIRKRVRAKVALACDGVFSAARRQVVPTEEDRPLFFGQLNWATIIETKHMPSNVHPPNAVHYFMYEGNPRWMSMMNDGGQGFTFWQFRVADPEMALSLSANKGRGGLGLKGVKEALLPVAKPCPMVYQGIQAIPERQIFERSIVGRLVAPTWLSAGARLALVGDAAHGMHPNIAQGANSAFESTAVVVQAMVEEFARHNGDLDRVDWKAALKTFQERRKPRADIVQQWANMMGCYQATGNMALPKDVSPRMFDWILGEDEKDYPSQETLDMLYAFDPCSQPGVSKIYN